MCRKLIGDRRPRLSWREHVAASDIDLVFQRYSDGIARLHEVHLAARAEDRFNSADLARRQRHKLVPNTYHAAGYGARDPPEIEIGAVHPLHRHAEGTPHAVVLNIDGFEEFEQMRPPIPGHPGAHGRHIVAM